MISHVSFRNFLVLVAALPASVSAFNPMHNMNNKPMINTDATEGLKAASIDNVEDAWSSLTKMIHDKIDEQGGDSLSDEAKDDIIATALAGSVVGTVVGSPLVVGAALGYAGSQMLQGENGEKTREMIGSASKELMSQAGSAIEFTKNELEHEKDLSKVSAKILAKLQEKADEIQHDFEASPGQLAEQLKANVLQTVESEDFKALPKRGLNAFVSFLASNEVKKAQSGALKALKNGLESDEVKALKSRATQAIDSASSKITKA